jgi:hypothetical protein
MTAMSNVMEGYPLQASDGYLLDKIQTLSEACIWIVPIGRFRSFYSLKQCKPVKGYMICARFRVSSSDGRVMFLEPRSRRNRPHWHSKFKERYCKFDTYGEALHAAITYYEEGMSR